MVDRSRIITRKVKTHVLFKASIHGRELAREEQVRQVDCDSCGAEPGYMCRDTFSLSVFDNARWVVSHYGRYRKWVETAVHESVLAWVLTVLGPEQVTGKRVLEVGSYNVNGSVRTYLESLNPRQYLGVDMAEGPGVDKVASAENLGALYNGSLQPAFDVVISTEMLEHVENWAVCIAEMAEMTKAGGLLVLTTRSPGFPYHPYPVDTWRFTVAGMTRLLTDMGLLSVSVVSDPQVPGIFAVAQRPPLQQPWTPPWTDRENTAAAKDLFRPDVYEVTPTR